MKFTNLILKVTALVLATAAIICLVMANMERISDWLTSFRARVQAKKEMLCRSCPCDQYDDEFEDWDL
ncbi:MAG: hypothetical protein SOR61_01975 [Evtepia sp.]|uniref:hypothetical protein n=1 Tax=Evtepia sp. TaxID=2773933 RepID=UPI002A74D2EB|nr:hypothetical protein [Evtepia sp.]MDY3013966.1 hypothetical protein [Evtepia sp.]